MFARISLIALALMGFASTAFAATVANCPDLTWGQRVVGLADFGNIMYAGGILGTVGFLAWVLFLIKIPVEVYEFFGYVTTVLLMLFANKIHLGVDPAFTAFAGCIGFGAMLFVSAAAHGWAKNAWSIFGILAVVWTLAAFGHQSELIGFFAVMALFAALGFFIVSLPFMTIIGFDGKDALTRGTTVAFFLLGNYTLYRFVGVTIPGAHLFEYGVYLVGSLVGFTGLLILAYEGYNKRSSYFVRQLPIIVAGVLALFFGSVLQIPELQKIGGTFFGLYLLEKICDVPSHGTVGFALKGLVISATALSGGYLILRFKDVLAPYFMMM